MSPTMKSLLVLPMLFIVVFSRAKDLQNEKIRNGNVEVEDKLAMMEVLSLCDTNGDDRLSLAEAKICETLYCEKLWITNCPDENELNDLDLDKDGFLTIEEGNNYKLKSADVNGEVEDRLAMMEVLGLCDTNGDERLSLAEARICETLYCEKLGIANCPNENELNDLDLDKDGFLTIEEGNNYKLKSAIVNGEVE